MTEQFMMDGDTAGIFSSCDSQFPLVPADTGRPSERNYSLVSHVSPYMCSYKLFIRDSQFPLVPADTGKPSKRNYYTLLYVYLFSRIHILMDGDTAGIFSSCDSQFPLVPADTGKPSKGNYSCLSNWKICGFYSDRESCLFPTMWLVFPLSRDQRN